MRHEIWHAIDLLTAVYVNAVLADSTDPPETRVARNRDHDAAATSIDAFIARLEAAEQRAAEAEKWAKTGYEALDLMHRAFDQERAHVRQLREALEYVESAIGDRLLANGPLAKEYAHGVTTAIRAALEDSTR